MLSNTSDSNLLEYYIRPHLASEHNTTQELKAMQNCITTHVAALRCIYQFYGRLGLDEMPDNTIILKHFQFCQLIKDCRLHQHTSLAEIDRI
ncbi:radial spoke head 10 homolog B, partial [Clonorchis sinensis]